MVASMKRKTCEKNCCEKDESMQCCWKSVRWFCSMFAIACADDDDVA